MNIYIIGHLKPDLDTVVSAIVYAEFLEKAKRYDGAKLVPLVSGPVNKETTYVLNRFETEIPQDVSSVTIEENDAVILVDHNEESQRHEKINASQVIEIVDHHKINISFTAPLRLDVKPMGSTASIIFEQFEMYGINPSDRAKNLMLAAILSDTQGLKSSTTTGYDSETAHKLSNQLNLDLDKLTFDVFKAKSDIKGLSAYDLATKDYKIFDFNGNRVLINQIETVEPENIVSMKKELLNEMENLKSKLGVGQVYNVVTDIVNINSRIMYTNEDEKHIVEKAFTTNGQDYMADIGPKMSRKKDIAPEIEKAVNQA